MKKYIVFSLGLLILLAGCVKGKPPRNDEEEERRMNAQYNQSQETSSEISQEELLDDTGREYCSYPEVSRTFRFALIQEQANDNVTLYKLEIHSKKDKKLIQVIDVEVNSHVNVFNCQSRSYITGFNKNAETYDGMYGDLVVADFNFDGLEDFAIAKDITYAQFYDFYIQRDGLFVKENYLSSTLHGFPQEINKENKTLTTVNSLDVAIETQVFQYEQTKNEYLMIFDEVKAVGTDVATN